MHISRTTVVTLGVTDLERSTAFYTQVFGIESNPDYSGVSFFELPGTWISLYPLDKLAEDIAPDVVPAPGQFSGITLAFNARSREEVLSIFALVEGLGARVVKMPQETFWGGFAGYFADPDGYYWEVAWGPMFDFRMDGSLCFKSQ